MNKLMGDTRNRHNFYNASDTFRVICNYYCCVQSYGLKNIVHYTF